MNDFIAKMRRKSRKRTKNSDNGDGKKVQTLGKEDCVKYTISKYVYRTEL
jgi:hypothetical protein